MSLIIDDYIGSLSKQVMKSHRVTKMVFSSSATVYGQPQYLPVNESHVTGQLVTNPYGRTKYFIEEILRDLCASDPVGLFSFFFSNESIDWFTILAVSSFGR